MRKDTKKAMALALGMGGELVAYVLVGLTSGYYIGGHFFQANNWGAVVGTTAAFAVWIWRMMQISEQYLQTTSLTDEDSGGRPGSDGTS